MSAPSHQTVAVPTVLAVAGGRPRLREGLVLHADPNGGGWLLCSQVPGQERSIAFGPHEFRLASLLDGTRTVGEIRDALSLGPGLESLCIEHVNRMIDWMREMHLLAPISLEISGAEQGSCEVEASPESAADQSHVVASPRQNFGYRFLNGVAQAACIAALVGVSYLGVGWLRSGTLATGATTASSAGVSETGEPNDRDPGLVPLAAEFDGVVRELYVRDGDKVEAGELLGLIDNLIISRHLDQLRQELEACQNRRDSLYRSGEMAQYRHAVEHMASITRTMGQLRLEEECIELRSPCAGVIRAVNGHSRQVGEQVASGQALLTVERNHAEASSPFLVTSSMDR